MISTVTLSFDLTYTNPVTGALQPRGIVIDSTDYTSLGIDVLIAEAKGLGIITFNGDIIVDLNTVGTPMIDLQNWDFVNDGVPTYTFDLPLDLNGNVANGVYSIQYSLRLTGTNYQLFSITLPNTIVTDGNFWLANFLEAGDTLILEGPVDQPVVIASITPVDPIVDPGVEIITSTVINPPFDSFGFDITNIQLNGVYPYTGCTQVNADVSFIYDCEVGDSGTWSVANTTPLAANEVVASLNCTINYPSWATLSPTFPGNVVVTSLPYPSAPGVETPLATGTYTVSLTQQIQQTQTSGLIVLYSRSVIKEFQVSCAGTLCGLVPCIENLRAAHQAELVRNRISKYQVFVDNVLMYYIEAMNYRSCGELDKYRAAIACLQAQLDASGCDCACCDDETYYWVSNNSGVSVIESLIASFQFRLFNGIPGITEDVTQGVQIGALWQDFNTGIIYRCTSNTEGAAVWEEYYAPGVAPNAIDVPAVPSPNFLTANNVQLQLNQVDALAVFGGTNGLNKVGNDVLLGGALDISTTINVNGNDFIFTSDDSTLEVIATGGVPLLLNVNQPFSGVGINAILTTTNTAGVGANGIGSSIQFVAENAAGSTSLTSTVRSTWVNAAASNSNFQITTKNANVESPALTLNFNGSATLNEYGQGNFIEANPTYFLSLNSSGSGQVTETALVVPKVYTAILTQSGSADPTATVVLNTTGETILWRRVAAGLYRCEATGSPFKINKTTVFVNYGGGGSTSYIGSIQGVRTADNYVIVGTLGAGATGAGPLNYEDGLLVLASIKIEVYP